MHWNFDAEGPISAELSTPAGLIEVDAGDTVEVDLEPTGGGGRAHRFGIKGISITLGEDESPGAGDELVAATEVGFVDGRLRVRVPEWAGRSKAPLHLRVTLPAGSRLATRTASADVVCRARVAAVDATTASGDLAVGEVDGVGARLDVSTVSGDLTCDLPFQDRDPVDAAVEIVCRTMSGDVHVGARLAAG